MAKKSQKQGNEENMEKAVAVRPQAQAPAQAQPVANPNVTSNDILIPKILVMQMMSKKVIADEAKFGEFRDSLENNLLGSLKEPLEFIPIHMEKIWVEYEQVPGQQQKKYKRTIPIVSDPGSPQYNDDLRYDDGNGLSRDRVMNFYVLLPKEMELGGIPYIISFRRMSLRAGKALATQMYVKNLSARKDPWAVACLLGGDKTSNDKGTFATLSVKPLRQAELNEKELAKEWYQRITGGQVRVDNSDIIEESSETDVSEPTEF